jgi:hypothetical protein
MVRSYLCINGFHLYDDFAFYSLYYLHVDPYAHMPRINRGMVYLGALPHCGDTTRQGDTRESSRHTHIERYQ